jgi:putative phosphoesterase
LSGPRATTIAVVADTHMPRGLRRLPERCVELLAGADAIIHAGDFVTVATLERIQAFGPPVHAVHGNVDEPALRRGLPPTLEVEIAGARIGIVHDGGSRAARPERLRRMFPDADCVIFGHTHMPEHGRIGAFQIFNPGSPTERRRAPTRSMGMVRIDRGAARFRHFAV